MIYAEDSERYISYPKMQTRRGLRESCEGASRNREVHGVHENATETDSTNQMDPNFPALRGWLHIQNFRDTLIRRWATSGNVDHTTRHQQGFYLMGHTSRRVQNTAPNRSRFLSQDVQNM